MMMVRIAYPCLARCPSVPLLLFCLLVFPPFSFFLAHPMVVLPLPPLLLLSFCHFPPLLLLSIVPSLFSCLSDPRHMANPKDTVRSIAYNPKRRILAAGTQLGRVCMWHYAGQQGVRRNEADWEPMTPINTNSGIFGLDWGESWFCCVIWLCHCGCSELSGLLFIDLNADE